GGGAPPPVIPTVSDADAIRKVLDLYQQAYNYRDSSILWKIWPDVPDRTRLAIDSAFKSAASIRMTLNVEPAVIAADGRSASVKGQLSQSYVPRAGSVQPSRNDDVVFSFKRKDGAWVIADVR